MYKNKHQAITLLELLVSIGVMTITISLAAMFIKFHKPGLELSGAALGLKNTFNEARQLALTTQINHGVRFDIMANTYQVIRLDDGLTWLTTATLPTNVIYQSIGAFTDNTVSFNAGGGASQAGAVILQNSADQTKIIVINPSGYVSIE